jgi:hypothetical protein
MGDGSFAGAPDDQGRAQLVSVILRNGNHPYVTPISRCLFG